MAVIYAIENLINGKHYIGCTGGKPSKRMREHRCLLRAGTHASRSLQSDWNEMGEEQFRLKSLDYVHVSIDGDMAARRAAEIAWMLCYEAKGLLYNERIISFQPPPGAQAKAVAESARIKRETGWKQSPESNLKRRLAQLGIPKGHGAKISATKQARKNK